MKTKFTFGADPEMFLKKDGGYVAVTPYIKGTKQEPEPLPSGGNAQRDNVAIEFGIRPASSRVDLVHNIGATLKELKSLLPDGVGLDVVASANFPKKELVHPECKMFGCDPDFSAWTMGENKVPEGAENSTFRSCGGHIHVGYLKDSGNDFLLSEEGKAMTVRVMDCLPGLVSTVLDHNKAAIERRKLYGKAGCYRPTDYGVEYRTLSNYWIKSPALVRLMHSLVDDTLAVMQKREAVPLIDFLGAEKIQNVIEKGMVQNAKDMINGIADRVFGEETKARYRACVALLKDAPFNFEDEWKGVGWEI